MFLFCSCPPSPPLAPSGPAARFTLILDGLGRAIAARMVKHPAAAPLLLLAWTYLRHAIARFTRLAAQQAAGQAGRASAGTRARRPAADPRPRLPGGHAWLVRLVPEAACFGSQLQHLIATDPDMAGLLQAAPRAGRILRPLCRMLGVRPVPAVAALPPRQPGRPEAGGGPAAADSGEAPPQSPPQSPPRSLLAGRRATPGRRRRGGCAGLPPPVIA